MPKFRFSAVVGVSAYTIVEAETEEQAMEIAQDRDVVIGLGGYGHSDHESWIVEEADGRPHGIHLAQ